MVNVQPAGDSQISGKGFLCEMFFFFIIPSFHYKHHLRRDSCRFCNFRFVLLCNRFFDLHLSIHAVLPVKNSFQFQSNENVFARWIHFKLDSIMKLIRFDEFLLCHIELSRLSIWLYWPIKTWLISGWVKTIEIARHSIIMIASHRN